MVRKNERIVQKRCGNSFNFTSYIPIFEEKKHFSVDYSTVKAFMGIMQDTTENVWERLNQLKLSDIPICLFKVSS